MRVLGTILAKASIHPSISEGLEWLEVARRLEWLGMLGMARLGWLELARASRLELAGWLTALLQASSEGFPRDPNRLCIGNPWNTPEDSVKIHRNMARMSPLRL